MHGPSRTQRTAPIAAPAPAQPTAHEEKPAAAPSMGTDQFKATARPKPEEKSEGGFFSRLAGTVKDEIEDAVSVAKVAKDVVVNVGKGIVSGDLKGGDPVQLALGTSDQAFSSHRIVDDPADLSEADPLPSEAARRKLETKAETVRGAWSAEEAGRYEAIAEALSGHPQGEAALLRLTAAGKLDGALLSQLEALATRPLTDGIERQELLTETLRAIENPVRMNQRDTNTCGGVSAQIMLATSNSAEYVRLIAGLASPEGKVELAGGKTIARDAAWKDPETGASRALPLRLLTPGLMDLAQEGPMRHDANKDNNTLFGRELPDFVKDVAGEGNFGMGQARMVSQLLDRPYQMRLLSSSTRDDDWNALKQALKDGLGPIPTGLYYRPPGRSAIQHYVLVESVKDGLVTILNPWGKREAIPEADYKRNVIDATLPDR